MMEYLNERSYLYDLRPVLFHEKDKPDGTNNTHAESTSQALLLKRFLMLLPNLPTTTSTANSCRTQTTV